RDFGHDSADAFVLLGTDGLRFLRRPAHRDAAHAFLPARYLHMGLSERRVNKKSHPLTSEGGIFCKRTYALKVYIFRAC
ncbi:hypothetical protein HMPREF3224_02187, partial [Anaerococcus hydrogenalis]